MKKTAIFIISLITWGGSAYAQGSVYAPDVTVCFNWNNGSSVWDSVSKQITTYTNMIQNGQALEQGFVYYNYQGSQWVPSFKMDNKWNGFILEEDSSQNYISNAWVNSSRTVYTYDANYNQTQYISYNWNTGTSSWDPFTKQDKVYNGQNQLIELINASYISNAWVPTNKTIFSYDGNGNETERLMLVWNTGTSQYDSANRQLYQYNASNWLVSQITKIYVSNTWQNQNKWEYTYDGSGNIIMLVSYIWSSQWDSTSRTLYTYNAGNQLIERIHQNYQGGTWTNSFRFTFSYDANGNVVNQKFYTWNSGSGSWVPNNQNNYTFDSNNNQMEYIYQYWDGTQYVNSYRCIYGYVLIMNISDHELKSIHKCRFANPYKGEGILCNLDFSKPYMVSLYSLQGKLIERSTLTAGNIIHIRKEVTPGLYILQITSEDGKSVVNEKVVIE